MDLSLYASNSGVFIAVPDCLRPSIEAEHLHGPLEFKRRLRLDEDRVARVSVRLADEIDVRCYAVITAEEASVLFESVASSS